MPARLTVHPPLLPAQVFSLEEGRAYCIGRDPACEVCLEDDRVSRRHARLEWDGSNWCLEDLGSKNGTSIAGERVARAPLRNAAWIGLGGLVAQFEPGLDVLDLTRREERASWRDQSAEFLKGLDPGKGLDYLLGSLMESLLRMSGADRGFVLLVAPGGGLDLAKVAQVAVADLEEGFTGSLGAVERALESAHPVVVSDAQSDAFLASRPSIAEASIRNLVCLPLVVSGRVIGVVYADGKSAGATFTELDVEVLEALVSQAALALWAARLEEEIRRLAGVLSEHLKQEGEPDLVGASPRIYVSYGSEAGDGPGAQEGRLQKAWTGMVRTFRDRHPE